MEVFMKTIKLGIVSFVACLVLGAGLVLVAPPEAQSDVSPCRTDCGYIDVACGPVGSCAYPLINIDRYYTNKLEACDIEGGPYDCPTFLACGNFCW